MSLTKRKISITVIIAAACFALLAFLPYFQSIITSILQFSGLTYFINNLFSIIFDFGNATNLLACIVMAVGIFTKFDKIALTASSGLFWIRTLVSFITSFRYSFQYVKTINIIISVLTNSSILFAYFSIFAIAVLLTILLFTKKEAPKFLKLLLFIPVVILAVPFFISTIISFISIFSSIIRYYNASFLLNIIIPNIFGIFQKVLLIIGFTAVAIKIADLKKKPKNVIEISEDVIVENVITE